MMNTSVNQGSAKIYQFPVGGRAALAGRRDGETRPVADAPSIADCSGSWYHAAAIQDANAERDH
jgi:crotonobetainyl-CoA:carnitine CoA-transferase CaiB-like acyl-CoA transferase